MEPVLGERYRECRACGFLWRVDRENFPDPNLAYQQNGERVRELLDQETGAARSAYYAAQVARFHGFASPPGRLLELGCGSGGLAKAFQDGGWEVTAVDSSPALCRNAERLLGPGRVVESPVENAELPPGSFDAVLAIDILEHIPDPRALPRRAFTWLRDGGVFMLQTPNGHALRRYLQRRAWNLVRPETHFVIHTPRSLRLLMTECGFRVLAMESLSGKATAGPVARMLASIYGSLLRLPGMGSALSCVTTKSPPLSDPRVRAVT